MTATSSTPTTESRPIKIVIVEDHAMFREWLGQLVAKNSFGVICGEATNIRDGLKVIRQTEPDLAMIDLTLPGSSGLELIKDLKAQRIAVPALVLSMHEETLYAERVLRAGGRGYISKLEPSETLLKAIRHVLGGGIYLGEKMTRRMLERMSGQAAASAGAMSSLADRELEVFFLIGKGFNGPEIAHQLHLGETTIESYRTRIREKLGVRNAADLYCRAAQWLQQHGV